jgi:amino acid transporter
MALAIALSVIATTGVTIVLTSRIIYGMASHRVLPPVLGNVNRRFSTPVAATLVVGLTLLGITWVYLLFTSLANVFTDVIAVSSVLFATFYILTAVTATAYYWRRIFSSVLDAVNLGLLPLAAAGFLGWVVGKTLLAAPASQLWSLVGIVGLGVILIPLIRFGLRPQYFHLRPETENRER